MKKQWLVNVIKIDDRIPGNNEISVSNAIVMAGSREEALGMAVLLGTNLYNDTPRQFYKAIELDTLTPISDVSQAQVIP